MQKTSLITSRVKQREKVTDGGWKEIKDDEGAVTSKTLNKVMYPALIILNMKERGKDERNGNLTLFIHTKCES